MSSGPWEIGTRDDPESVAGRGTVIPLIKRLRTLADTIITALTNGISSHPGLAIHVHEPAANTAAVVTLAAAGAGVANVIGLVGCSYDVLPAAGSVTIEDGLGTTVFKLDIAESGAGGIEFSPGLRGSANTALIVTLAAGGAGVSGIVSLHAWTE